MERNLQVQLNLPNPLLGIRGCLVMTMIDSQQQRDTIYLSATSPLQPIVGPNYLFSATTSLFNPIDSVQLSYRGVSSIDRCFLSGLEILELPSKRHSFFPVNQFLDAQQIIGISSSKRSSGKFEIFKGKDKQFYFHLRAANGEIIAASEGYRSLQGARKGIQSIQLNASESAIVEAL